MSVPGLALASISVRGQRIFSRTGGRPARIPIVLVHGAVISGRYMVPTAALLAAAHRVHVPDLPGFGHSDEPAHPYSVPELAEVLHAWLDVTGIAQAHLLGNSLGAQVVAELAVRWPERAASVILVGPTVDRAARTRVGQLWRLAQDAVRERPSLIPLHLVDLVRAGWRFAVSTLDIALADRIEEKVPRIGVPLLVVCGDSDPLAPVAWCSWLASQSPHADLRVLEGPHALNYSRPEALAGCVLEWTGSIESGVAAGAAVSGIAAQRAEGGRG